ncbi:hypothetical protein K3495_g6666 [Podosphaera aphanis]|nr:hypothetical protein K3495_g6666 [Podosphaera aphanis]
MWGKAPAKTVPRSAFSKIFPLLVLLSVTAVIAVVLYHLYVTAKKISSATTEKMQHKNVVFSKDGVKIGVRELGNESYVDKSQSYLVKAWNLSTFPGYSGRFRLNSPTFGRKNSDATSEKKITPKFSRSSISK